MPPAIAGGLRPGLGGGEGFGLTNLHKELSFSAVLWLAEGVHSRPSPGPWGARHGVGQARPSRLRRRIYCSARRVT